MSEIESVEEAEAEAEAGVKRPREGTKTGALWDMFDTIRNGLNHEVEDENEWETPNRKSCITSGKDAGFAEATAASQYAAWRKAYDLPMAPPTLSEAQDKE